MSVKEIIAAIADLPDSERRRAYVGLDELRSSDPVAPPPRPLSAHDKAKHLIGPGSGLSDLSSNKDYLKDLGESSLS
ncbi:MAG: hypothetical protein ABJF88_18950 [Rhodothermales bacterium]